MNKELAEFVGILLGDGSIDAKRQHRIQITLNKTELEYAKYIIKIIKKLFAVKILLKFRKTENALDIQIFNKELVDFLINKIGMKASPKWGRAVIPKIFMNTKLEKYVLRGYFDTDGSVVITNNNGILYPRLEMKICPSPMRNSIIDILDRLNFRFGAYNIENKRTRIQMNGQGQLGKWLKEIGIKNPNYLKKAKSIAREGFEPSTFTPSAQACSGAPEHPMSLSRN